MLYMPLLLAFIAIRLSILIVSETIKNQFSMTFFQIPFLSLFQGSNTILCRRDGMG